MPTGSSPHRGARQAASVVAVTVVALVVAPLAALIVLTFATDFNADDAGGLTAYGVLVGAGTLATARAFHWRRGTSIVVAVIAGFVGVGVLVALNAFARAVGN